MNVYNDQNGLLREPAVSVEVSIREKKYFFGFYSFYTYAKRISDFLLALIGIVLSLPIMLVVALAIRLESQGSVFFIQERVGQHGRIFKIIKFRSMTMDAEKNGAQWAQKNDSRVTRVGKFIRKTRLDEIPQFINVLKGDMSLIGPRPERPMFTEQFNEEIPGFTKRLEVKPGITGWAQVNGGYEINPKQKLELDLYYIKESSFRLDMKIMLKTIGVVFTGDGAR
ncbi:sugar transferase [Paenibacillus chitinolyticus]|uniref:sugar transferase n=1 Tax=Paenibacillus chitinolyticus TaxID=79263 RepID=UPI002DBDD5EB|nr:sugar transferase [Paenibacillus chitinolyticus]MEC0247481.1 sugar transferase [Paenibacillus chitinolyticus]